MALTDAELTILGLVAEQARHGYELERVIAERGIREWTSLGFSSIYYVLDRLTRRGLLEPVGPRPKGRSRVTFRITAEGRRELVDGTLDALATVEPPHPRVLVGMANSPGVADAAVAEALARRAEGLRERLAAVRTARQAQAPLPPAAEAIFDYAEAALCADLVWTERTGAGTAPLTGPDRRDARRHNDVDQHEDLNREDTMTATEVSTERFDIRKIHKQLYAPPRTDFVPVEVPELRYLAVDGRGDPNTAPEYAAAVEALYSVAYTIKFASKAAGRDIAVAPLEGLWRADDNAVFLSREKGSWEWTMLIAQPEWIDEDAVTKAVGQARTKKIKAGADDVQLAALDRLRLLTLREGASLQILHVGSYDDETPTLRRLHGEYLPAHGLTENGDHHEIYLGDPRRTAPERLKTILRQPVRPA